MTPADAYARRIFIEPTLSHSVPTNTRSLNEWNPIVSTKRPVYRTLLALFLITCPFTMSIPTALALPSFARQTGMSCEACHTVFPELTHFGRMFKANGYTLTSMPQVHGGAPPPDENVSLNWIPPLSVMAQISDTSLSKPLPDSTGVGDHAQNGTVAFPQQLSLFYAGRIAPHLGVFGQLTYSNQGGTIAIDNTDFRFADSTVLWNNYSLIYGVSLNNNPTVQDLWNTVPAWGFPYANSNAAVTPLAHTAIDQNFAQDVAGLTAYVFLGESIYAEAGAYRSAKQGYTNNITGGSGPLDGTATNVIDGVAPYWRLAYEQQWGRHSIEVGGYGVTFKVFPGGSTAATPAGLSGPVDRFADVAEDFQYQFLEESNIFTLTGTHIHESQSFNASFLLGNTANQNDTLDTSRVTATYYFRRKLGGSFGYFSTTGTTDPILYPANPTSAGVVTSATGRPNTAGTIVELDYLPWLNVKLSVQYTNYLRFNGASMNYDGLGRDASDNNTLYLLAWFAY